MKLAGGDCEEWHVGLGCECPGDVGLACSWRTFQKYAASSGAAHLLSERDVLQKEVESVDQFALCSRRADHVAEANLCVLGAQHRVR